MSATAQGNLAFIETDLVALQEGHNPRRYFDDNEFSELVESVRQKGIIQSIAVRERDDSQTGYWVIAGERRLRAARQVGLDRIPCVILDADDKEAHALAVSENCARSDMSPAEEARAVQKALAQADGDREEARKRLGFSARKFNSRFQLMHAAPCVLDALEKREIKLGHCELLASLPSSTQEGTLPKIIDQKIPVETLKKRIAAIAQKLSEAVFDTADCAGCPQNSNTNQSLFKQVMEDGYCSNRECYHQHVLAHYEKRREELKQEHNAVWLDFEKKDGYAVVYETGDPAVGPEQMAACKGCAHFGCVLMTAPGLEGHTMQDCCFQPECHREKAVSWKEQTAEEGGPESASCTEGGSPNVKP